MALASRPQYSTRWCSKKNTMSFMVLSPVIGLDVLSNKLVRNLSGFAVAV